jgi:hypothetical protein
MIAVMMGEGLSGYDTYMPPIFNFDFTYGCADITRPLAHSQKLNRESLKYLAMDALSRSSTSLEVSSLPEASASLLLPQLPIDIWRDLMSYFQRADLTTVTALGLTNRKLRKLYARWLIHVDLVIANGRAKLEDRLAGRVHGLVRLSRYEVRLYRLGRCVALIDYVQNPFSAKYLYEYARIEYDPKFDNEHSYMYKLFYDDQWKPLCCQVSISLNIARQDDVPYFESLGDTGVSSVVNRRCGWKGRHVNKMIECIYDPQPLMDWYRKQGL